MRQSLAHALAEERMWMGDRWEYHRSFWRLLKRLLLLLFEFFLCRFATSWRRMANESSALVDWYEMANMRQTHEEHLVLDDDSSHINTSPVVLPPVGPTLSEPSNRKQVNVPREVLAPLEQYGDMTERKISSLITEAIAIYLSIVADNTADGRLMPSKTSNRLHRLAIEMDCNPGYILRLSAAIGCRLLEEPIHTDDSNTPYLFDALVDVAKSKNCSLAELIMHYAQEGLCRESDTNV